jgi:ribosome biogenesis GTPase
VLAVGTVTRLHSDVAEIAVEDPDGGVTCTLQATLRGRLELEESGEKSPLVVGDRVRVRRHESGAVVEERLPRRTRLSRPHPRMHLREQVIAANVDRVLVVASPVLPPFRPGLVDRYLVAASVHGLPAALAVTKCDLVEREIVDVLVAAYGEVGVRTFRTRVDAPASIEDLRRGWLSGCATVLVGQSGVGKTTLRNALLPPDSPAAATAPLSPRTSRGVHVTTVATFEPMPPSGFLVDTPGSRQLGLWGVGPDDVQVHFPEFAAAACRFGRSCRHLDEPGCGVRELVEAGRASAERLASLVAIRDSLLRGER